jgi:predicted ATPase
LAAARVVVLSPEEIEARLQDRFRLLTGGARTAVARQRTLEATVDWSYRLLSDVEQQLLSRLSVFPAAWTLEAAEHVCGRDGINENDVLDLLSRLVSKSLVVVDSEFASERRYRFLDTVRQYARERLVHAGIADRLRERISSFSSTSSVAYCPFFAITISWRVSGDCGSSRRTSGRRSNGA